MLVTLIACETDENASAVPVNDDYDITNAMLVRQGRIEGINHTASGTASIYELNGALTVVLDPYSSQNGPDLKIYLSKDSEANEYVRLGNLKSTMGKQSYGIPSAVDINEYHFVHVWCEKYTVVFARAEVK